LVKSGQRGSGTDPKTRATLRRLLDYIRSHPHLILACILTVILSTALGLAPPWLLQFAIDNYVVGERPDQLSLIALLMITSAVLKGAADFAKRYASEYLAQGVIHNIRSDVYRHLTRLSFSFYDQSRTGDLMSRVTADADSLKRFVGNAFAFIIANLFTIAGVAAVVAYWDLRLGLLYLLFLPLMVHAMAAYGGRVRPAFGWVRRKLADLTAVLREDLIGIEIIKLFGREADKKREFARHSEDYVAANVEAAKVSAFWMPYVHFLLGCITVAAVWYGGYLTVTGEISIGVVVGFVGYAGMLMRPIRQTGMMIGFGSQAVASARRIFDILDTEPEVQDAPDAHNLPKPRGKVQFQDVSFSYDGLNRALRDIDLLVEPGQTVAIVGPTGAGKSTLVHLLPRFYDVNRGSIYIDGHDISRVRIDSLRQQVGIVLQEPFLFATSIRENISYGRPDASMKEIIRCARLAQIHDFIVSLPVGYETPVGERGVTLSGGQKQRLALARVLLTDPAILILDEPTSSVDTRTEELVQRALAAVMRERTTFVIAHRLWTVQKADQIVVLDQGEIRERGTHTRLLAAGGLYAKLQSSLSRENLTTDNERGDA